MIIYDDCLVSYVYFSNVHILIAFLLFSCQFLVVSIIRQSDISFCNLLYKLLRITFNDSIY